MKVKLLFFGVITDLLDTTNTVIEIDSKTDIVKFKEILNSKFKNLVKQPYFSIAVNESYVNDDYLLQENDIVALIPPVSGG